MSRKSIAIVLLGLGVACAASMADPVEDLAKKMEALELRVKNLEQQLATVNQNLAKAAPNAALEQEATAAFAKVNQAVEAGEIDSAKTQLAAFNQKYGATQAARRAKSLSTELAVVGKSSPDSWNIEKWFQGEKDVKLSSGKTTLLVFWETWCPHCRREVPKMQAMHDKYKGKGLQLVGLTKVSRSATDQAVSEFIDQQGLKYPVAKETGDLSTYFGVSGVPAAAVLKDGKVIWRGHPARITDKMLEGWL